MVAWEGHGQPLSAVLRSFVPGPRASLWSPLYVTGLDLPFFQLFLLQTPLCALGRFLTLRLGFILSLETRWGGGVRGGITSLISEHEVEEEINSVSILIPRPLHSQMLTKPT